MMVNKIFPKIFSRSTPLLDGRASILEAARILSAPQVSTVIIFDKSAGSSLATYKAVSGYSILSTLPTKEGDLSKFFATRCRVVAKKIRTVKESEPLVSVIRAIEQSHLGVVLVAAKSDSLKALTTVELRDFLRLYRDEGKFLETNPSIGELASSPVLSVKNGATLGDILNSMLDYRVRKILVRETRSVVSDRDILSYLTSPRIIERMHESPQTLLKTPASELPSASPPFVDSRMKISDAVQLINPDTGDCLICDRGLVTLWDLVIKLEQSRSGRSLSLQEISLKNELSTQTSIAISGKAKSTELNLEEDRELSQSKKKQLVAIIEKMREQGFIAFHDVPQFARRRIVDPLYFKPPARPFHIVGINSGQKGGRKFTSVDFFGRRMLHESYYFLDWEKFSKFISMKLELLFRTTNPSAPKQMKTAFTRFMHDFGLHWTECHHTLPSKNQ